MDYFSITNLIISVLYGIMGLLTIHFVFFAVVGLFKKRKFPKAEKKLRYGVIIPARNEEAVVCNLIESVYKNRYPQDKLQVFVIAHNCTDRTAEVARKTGATVYEYNNPDECTMGYAFRYLFRQIEKDFGVKSFDGFFLFNADNVLEENYFEKMNDAFVACDGKSVITSFRNSKNFGSNIISSMYGLYFSYGCRFESCGRSALGCSTRVQGTGYVINSDIVKDGWKYVTLTEDWEFTVDQILGDTPIVYCDDAMFYDEQPMSLKIMWRQRLRWSRGHLLVCTVRLKDIFKKIVKPVKRGGCKHKFSAFDIFVNIMPVCVITVAITVLKHIFYLLSPLFGKSLGEVYGHHLVNFGKTFLFSYIVMIFASVIMFILERKRFPKIKMSIKILSVLLWPIFLLVSVPAEVVALFCRNLGWKPIPHTDTTCMEHLSKGHHKTDKVVAVRKIKIAEEIEENKKAV